MRYFENFQAAELLSDIESALRKSRGFKRALTRAISRNLKSDRGGYRIPIVTDYVPETAFDFRNEDFARFVVEINIQTGLQMRYIDKPHTSPEGQTTHWAILEFDPEQTLVTNSDLRLWAKDLEKVLWVFLNSTHNFRYLTDDTDQPVYDVEAMVDRYLRSY